MRSAVPSASFDRARPAPSAVSGEEVRGRHHILARIALVNGLRDLACESIQAGLLFCVTQPSQAIDDRAVCRDEVVHQFGGGYVPMPTAEVMDQNRKPVAEVPGGENLRQFADLGRRFLNGTGCTGRLRRRTFQRDAHRLSEPVSIQSTPTITKNAITKKLKTTMPIRLRVPRFKTPRPGRGGPFSEHQDITKNPKMNTHTTA